MNGLQGLEVNVQVEDRLVHVEDRGAGVLVGGRLGEARVPDKNINIRKILAFVADSFSSLKLKAPLHVHLPIVEGDLRLVPLWQLVFKHDWNESVVEYRRWQLPSVDARYQ